MRKKANKMSNSVNCLLRGIFLYLLKSKEINGIVWESEGCFFKNSSQTSHFFIFHFLDAILIIMCMLFGLKKTFFE